MHSLAGNPLATRRQLLLRSARAGWVVVTLLSLAVSILSLETFRSGTHLFWLLGDTVPAATVHMGLDQRGLSPALYSALGIAVLCTRMLAFALVALVLFWRTSNVPIALLVASPLVTLHVGDTDPRVVLARWSDQPP